MRKLASTAPKTADYDGRDGASLNRKAVGDAYEALALRFLEQHGLIILERNYRCKTGEIDLIMRDNKTVVFVEVRFRTPNRYASGLESIDQRKCRKIASAASDYLQRTGLSRRFNSRFDVISISGQGLDSVTWLQSAFSLSDL